jgi:predicted MFS family arabinose efflux permease
VVTVVFAAGARTSLAVFLRPIEADLGLDRATLSTAGALTALSYGLAQPPLGLLATRVSARWVMMGGVLLMTVCGFAVAAATRAWHLYLFAGLLMGAGFAGAGSVSGTVLLAKWFQRRLGLATGVMSSGIPAGQSLFLPLAAALIPLLGWRTTYVVLGLILAAVTLPVLAWLAAEPPRAAVGVNPWATRQVAVGMDVWLVGAGYFACGFTDQFVGLHLVALATEAGLDPLVAAGALSALLVVGIVGSVGSGPLADVLPAHRIMAGNYLLRALCLPLLLLAGPGLGMLPLGLFALLFGITYISNLAPGARLIRNRYGVGAVGTLMGSVGLAHQVGGAIGIAVGGLSVTLAGGYGPAVVVMALVALLGGLAQLAIPRAQAAARATA